MIERRKKGYIVSKGLVPVASICESVGTGKSLAEVMRMYPTLGMEDVFEALEFYALNTAIPTNHAIEQLLTLVNVGGEEIVLEVSNINQVVFIKLVELGRRYYKRTSNFATCMNNGLRISCLEILIHKETDKELDNDLFELVELSLLDSVPAIFEQNQRTKEDLDYDEYIATKEKHDSKI
tara:strand:+ start:11103 stop:11642 length:540 start_codon:yes stop_codon:yes gene_type:complete